uniref:GPR180/TMEM145 transmembrane domain-containing protein n=1 Tax=Acrobeloides nanus TaxID=290746 RepID=A0A914EB06_9BILA
MGVLGIVLFCLLYVCCETIRITGTWNTVEKRLVIATKFGFQQTDPLDKENSRGFIYGNITYSVSANISDRAAFLVIPNSHIHLLTSDSEYEPACSVLLQNISQIAYEDDCFKQGKADLLRWVPCPTGEICKEDEDVKPHKIIPGYQFTLRVEEPLTPQYWYVVLVSCNLNKKCEWITTTEPFVLDYDIWLTNGNPQISTGFFFSNKQFSFDEQNLTEIYVFAVLVYIILAYSQYQAIQLGQHRQIPARQRLLAWIIGLKLCGLFLQGFDAYIFSIFGRGFLMFSFLGELLRVFAICLLCLMLILMARGWSLNETSSKAYTRTVHYVWCVISLLDIFLFIYNFHKLDDVPRNMDIFQSWVGHALLSLRLIQAVWFLIEVKRSIRRELNEERAIFLVHWGAAYSVWFVYLIGLGFIAAFISNLWRLRIILSITIFANFVAIACLVHIFWPKGSYRKFFISDNNLHRQIGRGGSTSTELEEFEKMLICDDSADSDPDNPD